MSNWGMGWFGGGGTKKKEAPKNAILQLRSTLEMLSKREKHLQHQMDEQDTIARKNVSANKNVAKAALRRKKQFEHALEQTSSQMMTVEREISSIETANINKETFVAMQNAGKAMKQIHGDLSIDKVDQTMEDLREQHAIGEEISEALTQGSTAQGIDEDDLDEELNELQQEQLDEKMLKTGTVPVSDQVHRLPAAANNERTVLVPLNPPPFESLLIIGKTIVQGKAQAVEEDDEEVELRKLQAEMAM